MHGSLRWWAPRENRRWKGPFGKDLPLPAWAEGLSIGLEEAKPVAKKGTSPDERREAKLAHAEKMLAKAERRKKLAETVEKRWRRRVAAAERALQAAKRAASAGS